MELNGFEVEYSTGGLWENERKDQTSMTTIEDLKNAYRRKTHSILDVKEICLDENPQESHWRTFE